MQPNKAIVGANAFAHESGIHQDGMLKNAQTYEIMTPASVGLHETNLVLGKHSGRAAFKNKLKELGFDLGDNAFQDAFKRFKDLADKKKDIFDEDLITLIDDKHVPDQKLDFVSLEVKAGSGSPQTAKLCMRVDGADECVEAEGNGPVDAIFNAIQSIFPHPDVKLPLYQVHAVTGGTDAQASVTVKLEENGASALGQSADVDTMVASARAYIYALNKIIDKRSEIRPTEPPVKASL